ncbi:hypothetical protein WJX84_002873 [Apatococcus fuscideae]|uniref:Expansin-like EG45 domain-containing protein n=1 Tax=Apatococcus fuscideae TaxID=2026836 RepID=A0AAW1SSM1_9CHLO
MQDRIGAAARRRSCVQDCCCKLQGTAEACWKVAEPWFPQMQLIFLGVCLLALTARPVRLQIAEALGDWRTGQASFYGGELGTPSAPSYGIVIGSCGYGVIPQQTFPYWSVGALSTSNLFFEEGPVQGCGMCFQIQCINDGSAFQGKCNNDWATDSVTIMITDQCPGCTPDQIDLQALTFGKLAPLVNGRILMQYRRVTCTPPDPITVRIDGNNGPGLWVRLWIEFSASSRFSGVSTSGASATYTQTQLADPNGETLSANFQGMIGIWAAAVQARAAGTAGIQSVLIRGPGASWQPMRNTFGAAWEINNAPTMPADLFVTSDDGQQVTLYGAVTVNSEGEVATSAQFSALPNPSAVLTTMATSDNPPVAPGSTAAAVTSGPIGSGRKLLPVCFYLYTTGWLLANAPRPG